MGWDLPLFVHSTIDDMTNITPNAMRVYMHLTRRADKTNKAWPSYQTIGDHCFGCVSENPVTRRSMARKALDELLAARLISKENRQNEGGHTSNAYTLESAVSIGIGVPISTAMPQDDPPVPIGTAMLNGTKDTLSEDTPILNSEANASAQNAPVVHPLSIVLAFREFRDELQRESSNRTAVLMRAYKFCHGEEDAPEYGRLGAFAKRVGGAGMALELIWNCTSRPPNGPILDYLEVVFKARQGDRRHHKDTGKSESTDDSEAVEATREWFLGAYGNGGLNGNSG